MSELGGVFPAMVGAIKLRSFLLTAALVVGLLPVRPLLIALSSQETAAKQCLLHGSDCQCAAHCDRTQRHEPHTQEAAAKPACHRDKTNQSPPASNASTELDDDTAAADVRAPAAGCAMTSCSKESPLLLTAQGQPCLTASVAAELDRDPAFEAVRLDHPTARFSLDASPPSPPPES